MNKVSDCKVPEAQQSPKIRLSGFKGTRSLFPSS